MNQLLKNLVIHIALTIGLSITPIPDAQADVERIPKEALKTMLDDPNLIILDVRRGKDWKSSEFKIKGAHYAKPENYSEWVGKYSKEKKIVLYCA